jgi:ATP-dependent Clp protease protease subunit
MLKKSLILIATLLLTTSIFASDITKVNLKNDNKVNYTTLIVKSERAVVLNGVVRSKNTGAIIDMLKAFNEESSDNIYLIINSPGGSVIDGYELVNTIKSLKAKVYCAIESEAFSMAAIISQYCYKTYIHKYAAMMFHEASYSVEGKTSEINTMVAFTNKYLEALDMDLASQMKISYKDYKRIIMNEWWVTAIDAAKAGLVDGVLENLYYTARPPASGDFFILDNSGDGLNVVKHPLQSLEY